MSGLGDRLSDLRIDPSPRDWAPRVRDRRPDALPDAQRRRFREQLGLPVDRPVVMTGHQAEFWHPGILAKYLAADAAARTSGAGVAWIVVDQDANRADEVRYPVRRNADSLARAIWLPLADAAAPTEQNVPVGLLDAAPPAPLPDLDTVAAPCVADGLRRIRAALDDHARDESLALQVTRAAAACASPVLAPAPMVLATRLADSDLFRSLVDRVRDDPGVCIAAYNDAVRRHSDARVAELGADPDLELPLWRLAGPGRPRTRARASMLHDAEPVRFAPRALFMTALLRLAGCDLFIHGLGGGIYDRITEEWMHAWLGVSLAPTAVVTATLTLPIRADEITPAEIDRQVWTAHHARHDPAMLGDDAAAAEKRTLVARIAELKRAGADPSPVFRELHTLLGRVRSARAVAVTRLDNSAAAAARRRDDAAIAHDRTWPFPLYPHSDLADLKTAIDRRFT